jgi:outer membrane protein TolC
MVDKTDVDQFKLVLQTLENNSRKLRRQLEDSRRLLRYQIGIELGDSIILKDNLNDLVSKYTLAEAVIDFNIENNPDYKLLETNERISELNLKLKRSEALPTISAYYNHQENFNEESFTFTPPDVVGVNVSIPIFSSFQRMAKISQAKIEVHQSRLNKELASDGLRMEFASARSAYLNAYENFETEKSNLDLSRTIYENNLRKYEEGMVSSIELTQAQNQYLSSQSNYFNSIVELVSAKAKIDKLLDR